MTSIDIGYVYADCEIAEVYREKEVCAAKEHQCCECRCPIRVGERHLYVFGVWGGDAGTHRQHLICCEACRIVSGMVDCIPFGDLMAWWREERRWPCSRSDREDVQKLRHLMAQIKRRMREETP